MITKLLRSSAAPPVHIPALRWDLGSRWMCLVGDASGPRWTAMILHVTYRHMRESHALRLIEVGDEQRSGAVACHLRMQRGHQLRPAHVLLPLRWDDVIVSQVSLGRKISQMCPEIRS